MWLQIVLYFNAASLLQSGCPYFSSTGLNGGWQWDIIEEVSSCIVQVSFVDTRDPFSSLLTQTASCNISSKCRYFIRKSASGFCFMALSQPNLLKIPLKVCEVFKVLKGIVAAS